MKYIYLFVIIIVVLNLLKFVNCQNIQLIDISKFRNGNETLIYNKHPQQSDYSTCDFQFDLMATHVGIQEINLSFDIPSYNYEINVVISNSTSKIYKLSVRNVQFGYHQIQLIASSLTSPASIHDEITINYLCQEIDTSKLTIKVLPNFYYLRPFSDYYHATILIEGLNYTLNALHFSDNHIYGPKFGENTFMILNSLNYEINEILISFPSGNILLSIPPRMKFIENNDIVVKLFPNVSLFQEIGAQYVPLYTISSNSGLYTPIYKLNSSFLPTLDAIYGDVGNYTYIGSFNTYYGPGQISLTSQINLEFIEIAKLNWDIETKSNDFFYEYTGHGINLGTSEMFSHQFQGNKKNYYSPIQYSLENNQQWLNWPFGFEGNRIGPNNIQYQYKASFIKLPTSKFNYVLFIMRPASGSGIPIYIDSKIEENITETSIISYEMYHLYNFNYLIKLKIKSDSAKKYTNIGNISISGINYKYEKCTASENENPEFEIIVQIYNYFDGIQIGNQLFSVSNWNFNNFYKIDPPSLIYGPDLLLNDFNVYLISNISFLINNITVTNQKVANIMYFNYTDENVDRNRPFGFQLMDKQSKSNLTSMGYNFDSMYYSKWNSFSKLFEIEFSVPANIQHGTVPWLLSSGVYSLFNSFLQDNQQLNVVESNFDAYGPIFTEITPITTNSTIGWYFTIQDNINGFEKGEITIRGDFDGSIYKFQFTSADAISGDKFIGTYKITIQLLNRDGYSCFNQLYFIEDVLLLDKFGNKATFSTNSIDSIDPTENPFINFLDNPLIYQVQFVCPSPIVDITPPVLHSFSFVYNADPQSIKFSFHASDYESGLKSNQYPIVYALTNSLESIQCVSTIVSSTTIDYYYECVMVIPFGFGFSSDIIFSVYGFVNGGGSYSGYSTETLRELGFPYIITGGIPLNRQLKIEKTSKITSDGGDLWIIGKEFKNGSIVTITFTNETILQFTPITIYSTALLINIPSIKDSFAVNVHSNGEISNGYVVTPIIFNYVYESSSTTSSNSETPIQCLNNCSGNGYCNTAIGYKCYCYHPWTGIDCSSKVIVPPTPTPSGPSTEIDIGDIFLFGSITEIDINSFIVKRFTIDSWEYIKMNLTDSEFISNITVQPNYESTPTTTSIKIKTYLVNNSTIKYNVEMLSYKFESNLNSLQLIIPVTINGQTYNKTDKEFNIESNEVSENVNIQIKGYRSIYGRFSKNVMADSKNIKIENILFGSLSNITSKSIESFIYINLPNYKSSIIFDYDFSTSTSLLLNNSDNNNNISNSNSSSIDESSSSKFKGELTESSNAKKNISNLFISLLFLLITVFNI